MALGMSYVRRDLVRLMAFPLYIAVLGLLILVFGLGALVAMPWCGGLIARHGSHRPLAGFAILLPFALPAVVLAPGFASAAVAMFCFSAASPTMRENSSRSVREN